MSYKGCGIKDFGFKGIVLKGIKCCDSKGIVLKGIKCCDSKGIAGSVKIARYRDYYNYYYYVRIGGLYSIYIYIFYLLL